MNSHESMRTAADIIQELNQSDERRTLEAKACASGKLGKSFFETVCAFANEPGMGGGHLILGVTNDESDLFETYTALRQLTDCDTLSASNELRKLRDQGFLRKEGGGAQTYYLSGEKFIELGNLEGEVGNLGGEVGSLEGEVGSLEGEVGSLGGEVGSLGGEVGSLGGEVAPLGAEVTPFPQESPPPQLLKKLESLGKRPGMKIRPVILGLCDWREMSSEELGQLLKRYHKALYRDHLKPLIIERKLRLKYPEMPNHPSQAYITTEAGKASLKDIDS